MTTTVSFLPSTLADAAGTPRWLPQEPEGALVSVSTTGDYVRLAIVLAAIAVVTAVVCRAGGLSTGWAQVTAAARATLQLALAGTVITAVLRSWWLTAGFVGLMVVVASVTAGRRVSGHGTWWWGFLPVTVAALPVSAVLLVSGLVPLAPIAVVPVVGILVGGAMTTTGLSGKQAQQELVERQGEVEAALSLGVRDRDARLFVARDGAALALVPGLDQTRTVGLVSLPGAFVGMLLGGATPVQAAAVQLIVLLALLFVASVAAVLTVELVARGRLVPPAHQTSAT